MFAANFSQILNNFSRRDFRSLSVIAAGGLLLGGCKKRSFDRPPGEHDLGEIGSLLYSKQHIIDYSLLVFRDGRGWSCMSTNCSYEGCDLTMQEADLYCSCCNSHFAHTGEVLSAPASRDLPYFEIFYKENHLFADTSKYVKADYRLTTPEIEQALERLGVQIREQGMYEGGMKVPNILLGKGDGEQLKGEGEFEKLPDERINSMTDTKSSGAFDPGILSSSSSSS